MSCKEVQAKIYSMFAFDFTPSNVERLRSEINPHLLACPICRAYLEQQFSKIKESNKKWE